MLIRNSSERQHGTTIGMPDFLFQLDHASGLIYGCVPKDVSFASLASCQTLLAKQQVLNYCNRIRPLQTSRLCGKFCFKKHLHIHFLQFLCVSFLEHQNAHFKTTGISRVHRSNNFVWNEIKWYINICPCLHPGIPGHLYGPSPWAKTCQVFEPTFVVIDELAMLPKKK